MLIVIIVLFKGITLTKEYGRNGGKNALAEAIAPEPTSSNAVSAPPTAHSISSDSTVEPGAVGTAKTLQLLQTQAQTQGQVHTHAHAFDPSDTTKWYRASPEHLGRVGFITSMSR